MPEIRFTSELGESAPKVKIDLKQPSSLLKYARTELLHLLVAPDFIERAPQPLASVALEYDAGRDELWAIGTIGAEQFEPFFEKYAFKLQLEYGGLERARKPVEATTVVRELTNYCRTTIEC